MELQIYKNAEFGSVRTTTIGGQPYFVGKDVTDILGYQNGSRDINRHVDEEDRQKAMFFDGTQDKENYPYRGSGKPRRKRPNYRDDGIHRKSR